MVISHCGEAVGDEDEYNGDVTAVVDDGYHSHMSSLHL